MIQMCQLIASAVGVIVIIGIVLLLVINDESYLYLYRGEKIEGKHAKRDDK